VANPDWAPGLAQVAAYVTSRTVTATTDDGTPVNTFTADTFPTSTQVSDIITDACAWVAAIAGNVDESLYILASTVAALRTAGMIQLAFPVREGDVPNAAALLAQADKTLAALVRTQEAAGAGVGGLSPKGSFPCPPRPTNDLSDRPLYDWSW
jgi:hypothetical protein